jgi:hypothetical protein
VFTVSERESEVNTSFGSQAPGLRVEKIHFQYKPETSIVLGAHLARAPPFFQPTGHTLLHHVSPLYQLPNSTAQVI